MVITDSGGLRGKSCLKHLNGVLRRKPQPRSTNSPALVVATLTLKNEDKTITWCCAQSFTQEIEGTLRARILRASCMQDSSDSYRLSK